MDGRLRDESRTGSRWLAWSGRHRRGLVFAGAMVLAAIFVAANHKDVTTNFLFFTVTAKLWVGLLVCLGLGALIGYLGASAVSRRRRG